MNAWNVEAYTTLRGPFSAGTLAATKEGERDCHYVKDAAGISVVEYLPNSAAAERLAALLTTIDAGSITQSETPRLSPPTEEEIAAYRNLFRAELDKNMSNSSASPSTDAHRVALHKFVEGRNVQR
jgi:hypothetical protein